MPIGAFESAVLGVLSSNRNPDSFIAGATVLHQTQFSPRWSRDVDIFHDEEEIVATAAQLDQQSLRDAGFEILVEFQRPTLIRAVVRKGEEETKVEWVVDSAFRFFPVEKDPVLGWKLNFWDAATNKLLALFNRHEFRDFVDVIYLHEHFLHLGALAWAAAGKDPGLTPELIIDWLKRSTRYAPEEILQVKLSEPADLPRLKVALMKAATESEELFSKLPASEMGCFYLNRDGQPVCPEPAKPTFGTLVRHFGSVRGALPRIPGTEEGPLQS